MTSNDHPINTIQYNKRGMLRVFEYKNLRLKFGPTKVENGQWRRFDNEEIDSLYRPPNIVRVIKSRRLRWAGNVARMEAGWSAFKILTGLQE